MSEHEAYVACRCFVDGLTTEPPLSRSMLTLDRFGNVQRVGDESAEDAPEDLWEWRSGRACAHPYVRLVEEYWLDATGIALLRLLRGGDYTGVVTTLGRGSAFSSAVIIVASDVAARALTASERNVRHAGISYQADQDRAVLWRLLRASVETGNPVVGFYNGCSLGFD